MSDNAAGVMADTRPAAGTAVLHRGRGHDAQQFSGPLSASNGAAYTFRAPQAADYARLVDWIPDGGAARRWAGPELRWPQGGAGLALALYRETATSLSMIDPQGRLAGFGEYYPKAPGRLRLARLIVDPARRGQRRIDTLIDGLIAHARPRVAFETIELGVFADNAAAIRAYRRLGFVPIDATPNTAILTMRRTHAR